MTASEVIRAAREREHEVIATLRAADGGTIRIRRNGNVDAVDGDIYSISPGFANVGDFERWLEGEMLARD